MDHGMWLSETSPGGRFGKVSYKRSAELLAVDVALMNYNEAPSAAKLKALETALASWMDTYPDERSWKKSRRNRRGAVATLDGQIQIALHPTDPEALAAWVKSVERHRARALWILFGSAQVVPKTGRKKPSTLIAFEAASVVKEAREVCKEAGVGGGTPITAVPASLSEGAGKMLKALTEAIPNFGDLPSGIWIEIQNSFLREIAAALAPVVGHVVSLADVVKDSWDAGSAQYRHWKTETHRTATLEGDARAACEALLGILKREATDAAGVLGLSSFDFVARTGSALADGGALSGALIGLGTAIGKLAIAVNFLIDEYRRMKLANEILSSKTFDRKIFAAHPLLGCYFLTRTEGTVVFNVLLHTFGTPRQAEILDRMYREHILPLKREADRIIDNSRFEVIGLNEGTMDGWVRELARIEIVAMRAKTFPSIREFDHTRLNKVGALAIGVGTRIADPLAAQRDFHRTLGLVNDTPLSTTYFTEANLEVLDERHVKPGKAFLTHVQWRAFSSITFGKRSAVTVVVDGRLSEYRTRAIKLMGGNVSGRLTTLTQFGARLSLIAQRLDELANLRSAIDSWLSAKSANSRSRRRPFLQRLKLLAELEERDLAELKKVYDALRIWAQTSDFLPN
jgi:hypothetical protein